MQNAITSQGWLQTILSYLLGAGTLGGLLAIYRAWLERKKPQAELEESHARTRLNNSDATSKDIDSSIKAAEMILSSARKLVEQEKTIGRLEKERDHWKDSYEIIQKELYDYQHGGGRG